MSGDKVDSSYTSFHPLSPDVKSITSGFSFSRLFDLPWKRGKKSLFEQTVAEEPAKENQNDAAESSHQRNQANLARDVEKVGHAPKDNSLNVPANLDPTNYGKCRSENSSPNLPRKEKGKYRNVKTILRRLSALAVDKKSNEASVNFKHDFKQYWMPDEHCKECYECGGKFNTFRRRHHCRVCGQIFCSRCCSQEVPGQTMGFGGNIRVCNYCYKIVKAYVVDDLDKSLEALKADIKVCFDDVNNSEPFGGVGNSLTSSRTSLSSYHTRDDSGIRRMGSSNSLPGIIERELRTQTSVARNPFDAFGVTPKEANDIKQDFLRDLWRQISDTGSKLELQSHRFRLKTYTNCFVGHELVDWLLTYGKAANRPQGVAIGQDLLDLGWIESIPATEEDIFKDEYMLYQPGKLAVPEMESQVSLVSRLDADGPSSLEGEESGSASNVSVVDDDDDETLPIWFKQISLDSEENLRTLMEMHNSGTPSLSRRISSSRHLDLDHATFETSDNKQHIPARDLSLHMKLDYFDDEDESEKQVRKEIYDQTNKLSLITHVPPPPLDTYVCVEGHPFVAKKKIAKSSSSTHFGDDILRGVEFPKPRLTSQVAEIGAFNDDNGETLARERLRLASDHHLLILLDQRIKKDGLPIVWKDVIMPIVVRISEQVVPDVRRDDDMDIRQYVWFKIVPVGDKPECQVVSGVAFPKNVVHKKMTCSFTQPKILMLSCAIEYQRVENKLTSIEPVVLQEYEFLKKFIARIVSLKPNIVLVEKTVARVAQNMLLEAGITLVHNIKSNVMENIARCTRAAVLQSMEQVTRPRLGTCQQFRLQKYLLPDGGTRTLMFFEGCAPDLGCSLVLQGGNKSILTKVKAILKYLIYVAYHLKLEHKFLMDEFAMPPTLDNLLPTGSILKKERHRKAVFKIAEEDLEDLENEEETTSLNPIEESLTSENSKLDNMLEESKKFKELISQVVLCSSPFCVYPLPYLLTEEGQNCGCRRFSPGQLYKSKLLNEVKNLEEVKFNSDEKGVKTKTVNPNLIAKGPHPFTIPDVVPRPQDQTTKSLLADFRAQGGLVDLKTYRDFEEVHKIRRKEVNIRSKERREFLGKDHGGEEGKDQTSASPDKKQGSSSEYEISGDCFDPYNHQKIAVLFSSYSSESHNAPKPCISPWAVFMEFYGRNDITLGGFLERYCFRPSYICSSHNCDVPMVNHVRYFAHGNGSLYIHMRNLESPIPGYDRTILTWSWCKQCKQVTPVVPLSFESWSLSFAKYLELRFYGGQYTRRASAEPCGHSLHQDHYQYFSFANMVASFKYRPIELYEVIIPSPDVVIGKERQPSEWENDVEEFCAKADQVLKQIMERIIDLRSLDPITNATREQSIKDFQSDFQAESYHFEDFMQCLRMKVDSLLSSERRQSLEDPTSASTEFHNVVDSFILKPSEKSALMTSIGNMLVNLKKKLCEVILAWNARLQEFIQQEKKREKAAKPSSSPKSEEMRYQPNAVPNEIGEYYPTVSQDQTGDDNGATGQNLQYTYIHAQTAQEPVSEVLLNNGAILRQTYLGIEPPKEYIASDINNETLSQFGAEFSDEAKEAIDQACATGQIEGQIYGQIEGQIYGQIEGQNSLPGHTEEGTEAHNEEESVGDRRQLKIDLSLNIGKEDQTATEKEGENGGAKGERTQVGSPYMVIKSPLAEKGDAETGKLPEMSPNERSIGYDDENDFSRKSSDSRIHAKESNLRRTGSVQVERGSLSDITNGVSQRRSMCRVESEDSVCSTESKEHWMVESRERSSTVINTLETDNLPKYLRRKLMSLGQSDETSSLHSSLFVEDGSDAGSCDLMSLQDVLDFPDEDQSYLSEADEIDDIKDVDSASEIGFGESAVDYEIPEVVSEDELIEPISITKKLKSLGLQVDESSECASQNSIPVTQGDTNDRDLNGTDTTRGTGDLIKTDAKVEVPTDIEKVQSDAPQEIQKRSNKDRKSLQKRRYPPLGAWADEDSDYFEPANSGKKFGVEDKAPSSELDDILSGKRPLFEENSPDELETKEGPPDGLLKEKHSWRDKEVRKSRDDSDVPSTTLTEGRTMGHRRLMSAPIELTPSKADRKSSIEKELPGSPFELVKKTPLQDHSRARIRSYSQGHFIDFAKGQEELTKMAEEVCKVDRKDLEMDDPEEIQYDESLDETLKSPETPSKAEQGYKTSVSTDVTDNKNEKRVEKSRSGARRVSDAEESERESVSSSSTILRNKVLSSILIWLNVVNVRSLPAKIVTIQRIRVHGKQRRARDKIHLLRSPAHEHYMLPIGDSVSVVINEKEPSSVIAYALSSIDYFNQLSQLRMLLDGPAIEQETRQAKQTIEKAMEAPEMQPQGKSLKRPRSWAGVSIKSPLIEYQINFPADLMGEKVETEKMNRCCSTVDGKNLGIRTRMSLADQYLMSSAVLSEAASNDLALDSPGIVDSDDAKTDSIDGLLDDKEDLESAIGDIKQDLPGEKTGKEKDENKSAIDFNIKLQFHDNSAKFYCNVYYAEQFRQLRELIFPEGEERYIQSLSRCVFWKARGGKSGSSFSKSLDDRFVMKQMSRLEVQSFVEFAPHYFQYMDKALKEQRPTTLAKILGVYRIGFKNAQTNTSMRQDVLVMENVFYNRKVNKIFDLKGSVRSRYVHTSGKEEVLMDENLLEMICETPLFIRPHSKAVLSKAIHNDSEFLSSHSVMDYSLLVGIDEVNFELVVGIIDYIRTFTWDKKLESYVKSTGILGGHGKMPTVVSPAVYRTRFTEAMHRYFLMVPDKWTGFGADHN
eukprot:gene13781-4710_t